MSSQKPPTDSTPVAGPRDFGPFGSHDFTARDPVSSMEKAEGGPMSPYEMYVWHRPRKRFTILTDDGIQVIHEGRGLTLDIVLDWEVPDADRVDEDLGIVYDLVVLEEERLVAAITRRDGHRPLIRRFDVSDPPPIDQVDDEPGQSS